MKVFMITWGLFCLLVVVGLIIVYATDNFPGVPAPQQVEMETEDECSPCEENLKRLTEAMEAGNDLPAAINAENVSDEKQYAEYLAFSDKLEASIKNAENMSDKKKREKKAYAEQLRALVAYERNKSAENWARFQQAAEDFQKALGLREDANLTEGVSDDSP